MKKISASIAAAVLALCLFTATSCDTASRVIPQNSQRETEHTEECPGGDCPDEKECPDGDCPGGDCPDEKECPDGNCPDGNCPDGNCPDGDCPDEKECPDGNCPDDPDRPLPPHMRLPKGPRLKRKLPERRQIPIRPAPLPGPTL